MRRIREGNHCRSAGAPPAFFGDSAASGRGRLRSDVIRTTDRVSPDGGSLCTEGAEPSIAHACPRVALFMIHNVKEQVPRSLGAPFVFVKSDIWGTTKILRNGNANECRRKRQRSGIGGIGTRTRAAARIGKRQKLCRIPRSVTGNIECVTAIQRYILRPSRRAGRGAQVVQFCERAASRSRTLCVRKTDPVRCVHRE
jgi:hypothetical protein